jgi:capsular polysaccharide export protein
MVDEVHVMTSLAGFEGLLRGKKVTCYGAPFFAGWGLTEDKGAPPNRRGIPRPLDNLIAATLILYPRYLDPVTGLPCPPEILITRLAEGVRAENGMIITLRRLQGRIVRLWQRK